MLKSFIQWLRRVITEPRQELGRWQRAVRFGYDLVRVGGRQLSRDRAPQMAAALAFRSLFALVPVLIVGMVVVRGFGSGQSWLPSTKDVFDSLGLNDVRVPNAASESAAGDDQPVNLSEWLEALVSQAAEVNVSAVGWIGGGLIVYAAISLVVTIENSFNIIFRAPQGRSWVRRIPLYWFTLTIGPIALAGAWYVDKSVSDWIRAASTDESWPWFAGVTWNVIAIWSVLMIAYSLLPNTWVDPRAAAAGAFVSSILLVAGKQILSAYISNAFAISQLYGSLGLVPLFMFWVYLMWLVVLFGVEVSSTLQSLHGEDLGSIDQRNDTIGLIDPAIVIIVMQVVADRFHRHRITSVGDIAQHVSLPDHMITEILERLVDDQYLIRVEANTRSYSLARPADEIAASDLIKIGFAIVDLSRVDLGCAEQPLAITDTLRNSQTAALADQTLADLQSPTA